MMKKWVILINQNANHNKFWAYEVEADGKYERYTCRVRFGRIGAIGQEYIAPDSYYVDDKIDEKYNKGYDEADDEFIETNFPKNLLMLWEL
jgi:predicted DNA-binding WGR domain protein